MLAWERLFSSYAVNELRLYDPLSVSAVAGLLVIVSAGACLWPLRRVVRLDPLVVLRHE
jgi:ABC-type lipoprotein release transport system permease subunit